MTIIAPASLPSFVVALSVLAGLPFILRTTK